MRLDSENWTNMERNNIRDAHNQKWTVIVGKWKQEQDNHLAFISHINV